MPAKIFYYFAGGKCYIIQHFVVRYAIKIQDFARARTRGVIKSKILLAAGCNPRVVIKSKMRAAVGAEGIEYFL